MTLRATVTLDVVVGDIAPPLDMLEAWLVEALGSLCGHHGLPDDYGVVVEEVAVEDFAADEQHH